MKLPLRLLLPLAATAMATLSATEEDIRVVDFYPFSNQLRFSLEDPASLLYPTGYKMEASPTMAAGSWLEIFPLGSPGYVADPAYPGRFTVAITKPPTTTLAEFYRFSKTGTAGDADGDGLSDAFESNIFTDPGLFDSDGDGFSDGVEFAYGTNPNDPNSKPVNGTSLPTVNFTDLKSTATEGEGTIQIQLQFDRSFNGTVNYEIDALSTAQPGTDFRTVSGSVSVNGNTGSIPITLIDDTNVSGQRVIIVKLLVNGNNYLIGGGGSHILLLSDNDSWWTGVLAPASGETAERSFRLKIMRQGTSTTTEFGAGAGLDGLDIPEVAASPAGDPAIGATSLSSAIVPEGTWPATVIADTAAQFAVRSPEFPVTAGCLLGNEPLLRTLMLNAQPSLNSAGHPHELLPARYIGDYIESLTGAPYAPAGATATQSSEYPGYPASKAIDGDLASFTYTNVSDLSPSWTLTLPNATPIVDIVLYDGYGSPPLSDITVQVFSDAAGTASVFNSGVLNSGNILSSPETLRVTTGSVNARVIRVSRPGPYLTLGEVKLYSPSPGSTLATASLTGSFVLVRDIPAPLPVISDLHQY